jgi:oligopeptide/dipeptide ABC transporter ATP-binding protein
MAVLDVVDLTTLYKLREGSLKACDGVSLRLEKGQALGLVGESACGKTTLALSLMKLLPDNGAITGGSIKLDGREIATLREEEMLPLRWKEISMIFQGAMNALNPVRSVGQQIVEALKLHDKLSEKEAWKETRLLFERVEIDASRVREYPHEFSGGMRQRVMIAMALACNPKIVIGDEPTTGLDVMVKAQILQLLEGLAREKNMSMILITHDLSVVGEICDKVVVMYAGKIVESGKTESVFTKPAHPYTLALLNAFPDIEGERVVAASIPGNPPNLLAPPPGCRFHERCSHAIPACRTGDPLLLAVAEDHYSACPIINK